MTAATTVALRFKGATLRVEIDPADVDRMLREMDGIVAGAGNRGGAMTWVLNTVRRNGHLTGDGLKVALTLLWLVCRHPTIGSTATGLAREGGCILAYDVTKNPAAARKTRGAFNWRAVVGGFDTVAPMVPWLPPADFRTAGSA